MGELKVCHRVPFVGQQGNASLPFDQWIPEGDGAAITVVRGGTRLSVSINRDCIDSMREEITDELLSSWMNIRVAALSVEVVVADIPAELGMFIVDKEHWPKGEDILNSPVATTRELAEQYASLGRQVMVAVLEVTNRVVSWAYAEHGVYWLTTREETPPRVSSNNIEFRACATFDGGRAVRWCPPAADEPLRLEVNPGLSIRRRDWGDLSDFVRSDCRADAIGEILGNARLHLANGHARGAVIEAVSALEASVSRFAKSPLLDSLRTDRPYGHTQFSSNLKHFGFTATVEHLLPLLLPPAVLTPDLLSRSCAAIQCRHNILHNQQRSLGMALASTHVGAACELIAVLRCATAASP